MGVGTRHTIANRKRNVGSNFLSLVDRINTGRDDFNAKGIKFWLDFFEAD